MNNCFGSLMDIDNFILLIVILIASVSFGSLMDIDNFIPTSMLVTASSVLVL